MDSTQSKNRLSVNTSSSETSIERPVSLQNASSNKSIPNTGSNTFIPNNTESNSFKDTPKFVPRRLRRGLAAQLCLVPEQTNGYAHSNPTKFLLLGIISFAAVVGPMGGAVFLPAIDDIVTELHSSKDVVNISYGVYVLSLAIFPIWWSSFSEQFGRRSIYLISFSAYFAFLIGCARVNSIGALMACRFLAGGCAASVQAVGAGTLSDIFVPTQRGRAMGYFYLGPLLGPLVGPIFGGLVVARWGWRATQWLLVIISGCIILSVLLFLPETLAIRQHTSFSSSTVTQINQSTNSTDNSLDSNDNITDGANKEPLSRVANRNLLSRQTSQISRISRQSVTQLTSDDLDNSNVADSFAPVIPTPSHIAEDDLVWAAAISHHNYLHPDDQIISEKAIEQGRVDQFNTTLGQTTNATHLADIESQTQNMDSVKKTPTSASEKEQRLLKASAQVDFKTLDFKTKLFYLFLRPLKSFKFLRYPPVTLTIVAGSVCFTTLYFLNISLETLYTSPPYNFNSIFVGLTYIPNSIGYVISSLLSGRYSDHVVRREKAKLGYFNAESRFAAHFVLAMAIYPCSLLMFGWTAQYKLHWIVPLVANLFFGLSSMVVMGTAATYLVDALPGRGSSGIAVNNFVRFILAAISAFISAPMNKGMGYGWMYTFLAILAALSSLCVWAIRQWGLKWRSEADFERMYM